MVKVVVGRVALGEPEFKDWRVDQTWIQPVRVKRRESREEDENRTKRS